jgi:hypothetical protein
VTSVAEAPHRHPGHHCTGALQAPAMWRALPARRRFPRGLP